MVKASSQLSACVVFVVALFGVASSFPDASWRRTINRTPRKEVSGKAKSNGNRQKSVRMVHGDPVSTDDYPFMVALQGKSDGYQWAQFCGGSLIRAEYPAIVLTAAHCIYDADYGDTEGSYEAQTGTDWTLYATLGKDDTNWRNGYDDAVYDDYQFSSYKLHARYEESHLTNDIALVFLNEDLTATNYETIALAHETPCCLEDDPVLVVGYGLNESDQYPTASLETVDLSYYPVSKCEDHMDAYVYYAYYSSGTDPSLVDWDDYDFDSMPDKYDKKKWIRSGMMCAWNSDEDPCNGDSGGPLVTETDANVTLRGLVSWGFGCNDGAPTVYTDVAYFRDWIQAASACGLIKHGVNSSAIQLQCNKLGDLEGSASLLLPMVSLMISIVAAAFI